MERARCGGRDRLEDLELGSLLLLCLAAVCELRHILTSEPCRLSALGLLLPYLPPKVYLFEDKHKLEVDRF